MTHSLPRLPFHFLALLAVVGCGGGTDPIVPTERVPTTITITPDPVSLTFLNHSVQLTARVRDQKGNVMATGIDWTIADPSVASIDASGLITSLAVGQTTLTATGLGLTASAEVGVHGRGGECGMRTAAISARVEPPPVELCAARNEPEGPETGSQANQTNLMNPE